MDVEHYVLQVWRHLPSRAFCSHWPRQSLEVCQFCSIFELTLFQSTWLDCTTGCLVQRNGRHSLHFHWFSARQFLPWWTLNGLRLIDWLLQCLGFSLSDFVLILFKGICGCKRFRGKQSLGMVNIQRMHGCARRHRCWHFY